MVFSSIFLLLVSDSFELVLVQPDWPHLVLSSLLLCMVPHIDYSITYRSLHGLTPVCLSYRYPNTQVNLFILMLPFLLHHASDKKFSRHSSLDPQFGISATSLNCVYVKSFQVWHRDLYLRNIFLWLANYSYFSVYLYSCFVFVCCWVMHLLMLVLGWLLVHL